MAQVEARTKDDLFRESQSVPIHPRKDTLFSLPGAWWIPDFDIHSFSMRQDALDEAIEDMKTERLDDKGIAVEIVEYSGKRLVAVCLRNGAQIGCVVYTLDNHGTEQRERRLFYQGVITVGTDYRKYTSLVQAMARLSENYISNSIADVEDPQSNSDGLAAVFSYDYPDFPREVIVINRETKEMDNIQQSDSVRKIPLLELYARTVRYKDADQIGLQPVL